MPLMTTCKASSDPADVNADGAVAIIAQVTQGAVPVIGAAVEALIEREGKKATTLNLLDDGNGADIVAGDGIYARYFTDYDVSVRYSISCSASATDATSVNAGFDSPMTTRAEPETSEALSPLCCGSTALRANSKLSPTGAFERKMSAGQITAPPTKPKFPPGQVRDLRATIQYPDDPRVTLEFTSPGGDYDNGVVSAYDIRVHDDWNTAFAFDAAEDVKTSALELLEGDFNPVPSKEVKRLVMQLPIDYVEKSLYFVMKSEDDEGLISDVSNVAEAYFDDVFPPAQVTDFSVVEDEDDRRSFRVSFTAPGDDAYNGVASAYEIRTAVDRDVLDFDFEAATLIEEVALTPIQGNDAFEFTFDSRDIFDADKTNYVAMRAVDNRGQWSDISNIEAVDVDTGMSGGAIAGIVIGCVFGVAIIAAIVVYFVKK